MIIVNWFLWFIIYSFIGWFYESTVCSVSEKRFVNRGFLNGPLCPVYGFGALLVVLVLYGRTDNVLILFLSAVLLTCTVEYLTSYLLEKLFHAKWWDYSNRRFNLNGRVCLLGAVVFGVLSVLLVRFIHPAVIRLTDSLPDDVRILLALLLFTVVASDTVITTRHIFILNGRLSEIQTAVNSFRETQRKRAEEFKNTIKENFEQSEFYNERIKTHIERNKTLNRRLFRAFPKMRSLKYEEAMKKLKESLQNFRDKGK